MTEDKKPGEHTIDFGGDDVPINIELTDVSIIGHSGYGIRYDQKTGKWFQRDGVEGEEYEIENPWSLV